MTDGSVGGYVACGRLIAGEGLVKIDGVRKIRKLGAVGVEVQLPLVALKIDVCAIGTNLVSIEHISLLILSGRKRSIVTVCG